MCLCSQPMLFTRSTRIDDTFFVCVTFIILIELHGNILFSFLLIDMHRSGNSSSSSVLNKTKEVFTPSTEDKSDSGT